MAIDVTYVGLYSDIAGVHQESFDMGPDGCTAGELAIFISEKYGPEMEKLLLEDNRKSLGSMFFAGGGQKALNDPIPDGAAVTITYKLEGG
ncbi:hypothetical protein LJC20_04160 [Eubacteriales bacterium OttesenSCG-928-M02]|nr:hypothetical protein [Eubacteriales bacterium OttesenSCG-928-M02]